MSRYCGGVDSAPILEAVSRWRDQALLSDGSVFSSQALWTVEGLEALELHFVQNLEEGEGTFITKLEAQLSRTAPPVKQVAAEMLWLMLLCPRNTNAPKKRSTVAEIWRWSGEELPASANAFLTDAVLGGIGSGGPGFNNHRWRELVFCINAMLLFKRMPDAERRRLTANGWEFAQWLEVVPDSAARQFRHMLVFMLFPDDFERLFGGLDRRAVSIAFSGMSPQAINAQSPVELDRTLRRVRTELEEKYATPEVDYYRPPLMNLWRPQDFRAATQDITPDHVLQAIKEIDAQGIDPRAESTGYDLLYAARRYPPKLVLSVAAKHANGTEFDRTQFTGGEDSSAFRLLRALGFKIVPKSVLPDILRRFFEQAASATSLVVSGYPAEYRDLQMKVSFGKGVQARVPWIAFLGPGQVPTKGSYPVVLYYRSAGVLVVAYGISETHDSAALWRGLEGKLTVEKYLTTHHGVQPERYGDSYVAATFTGDDLANVDTIAEAIDRVIDEYRPLLNNVQEPSQAGEVAPGVEEELYTLDDAVEGLFVDREVFGAIVQRLRNKRNVILQGPPGVGKTFFAKRLAQALIGSRSSGRIGAVQFHQTYSYEDFVQGYRPTGTGFQLKNGIFFNFCRRAASDLDNDYVFIIDEINRGNLSKVFGELMMLIEADKRGTEWAIPLTYAADASETFHVPRNLFLLGLMNTADRSLAMVDYALRRRFAFIDLDPGFGSPQFVEYMRNARASVDLIQRLVCDMEALNAEIANDRVNLGPGFRIGHSYFCSAPRPDGATEDWFRDVIQTEVVPLLGEYWFDNPSKVDEWERRLLGA